VIGGVGVRVSVDTIIKVGIVWICMDDVKSIHVAVSRANYFHVSKLAGDASFSAILTDRRIDQMYYIRLSAATLHRQGSSAEWA
jgi:hypothetical protein